ncbi:MAG TPA: AEC family transporter [Bacillota bacterium]|jgi:predicted permease|nr:AEC family transporter [Bacillota bacterium]HPZ59893.1 AEC family transporter [Bacillota bacterium]
MFAPFFVLFGLMAVGYLCRKFDLIDDVKNDGLGSILVHIALPALLLSSMIQTEIQGKLLVEFLTMTLLSVAFYFLYALFAIIYIKLAKVPQRLGSMVQLSMLTSNNGFMGFPITMAFFGQQGLFLMVANNLAMGIVVWSYGLFILKRTKRIFEGDENVEKSSVSESLRQIFNNTVVAIFIGLAIGIAGINSYIPDAVAKLIEILGSLATPLSMLYIGATLYNSSFSSLFRNRLILGVSITRLTLFAAATFAIVWLLPIPSLMKQISLLVITLPSAAVVPVMTGQYGIGVEESTKIVVLSTLLSLVITPLGVYIALTFL